MKRLTNLLSFLALFSLVVLSSCKDKKDTPSPNPSSGPQPSLEFTAKTGYTTENKYILVEGSDIQKVNIAWAATKNQKELKIFTVTLNGTNYNGYNNGLPYSIPTDQQNTYKDSIKFDPSYLNKSGVELKFVFSVTDNDGNTTSQTITLTTIRYLLGYSDGIFGGQTNSNYGSFSNSTNETPYTNEEIKTQSAGVDFVYYYGTTTHATIAAPNDASAQSIFNDATYGIQTWNTKNATKFKLTSLNAADPVNEGDVYTQTKSGVINSSVSNLAVGNVVAFITAGGRKGLIKVTALTPGPNGSITLTTVGQYSWK